MGRRLAVLGSAPAFEEVADEEGVEDAISLVVLGRYGPGSSRGRAQAQAAERSKSCTGRAPGVLHKGGTGSS